MKVFVAFSFAVFFVFSALPSSSAETHPLAPDFKIKDLKGNDLSLADYRGKVLFLNFWATWCPPCREEIPDFIEVYGEQKGKGLEIIGISLDELSPASLQAFVEKFKINYPVAFATRKIHNDYRPGQYIPATIVIDKNGRIRHKHVGLMDKKTLSSIFLKLAAE